MGCVDMEGQRMMANHVGHHSGGMNDYSKIDFVTWACMCAYTKFYRILSPKWMNYIFHEFLNYISVKILKVNKNSKQQQSSLIG